MSPAPATPPRAPKGKGSLSKWLNGHKWEAGLGAGGIVVTVYLAYRSRKNAAGTSTTSSGASQALPASYYTGGTGSTFDATQFGDVLAGLAAELGTAGQKPSGGTTFTPPTGQTLIGGGYGVSNPSGQLITSASGAQFSQVPTGAAILGQQYYYQPEPGVFTKLPMDPGGGTLGAPGGSSTPWFQMTSSSA